MRQAGVTQRHILASGHHVGKLVHGRLRRGGSHSPHARRGGILHADNPQLGSLFSLLMRLREGRHVVMVLRNGTRGIAVQIGGRKPMGRQPPASDGERRRQHDGPCDAKLDRRPPQRFDSPRCTDAQRQQKQEVVARVIGVGTHKTRPNHVKRLDQKRRDEQREHTGKHRFRARGNARHQEKRRNQHQQRPGDGNGIRRAGETRGRIHQRLQQGQRTE